MEKIIYFGIRDDMTLKWKDGETWYRLHLMHDDMAEEPRSWDEKQNIMACFMSRHSLGDDVGSEPDEFWRSLVRRNVSEAEIFDAVKESRVQGMRITGNDKDGYTLEEYCQWRSPLGETKASWEAVVEGADPNNLAYYIIDDLTVRQAQSLMAPYAEWLPLFVYEHGGMTMRCGSASGGNPFNDPWDSGQVGWIITLKQDAFENMVRIVRDEHGEPVKVEHKHEGGPSTWSIKTEPLTEENWRERACEVMEDEVSLYDMWLRGEVYGFKLFEKEEGEEGEESEWEEVDSCWGFYGDNLLENGMLDAVSSGLAAAIKEDRIEEGEARSVTVTHYEYD